MGGTLILVDESGAKVIGKADEANPLKEAADRMLEELSGVVSYTELASKHPAEKQRYEEIAGQEFTHMLVAMKDLFERIRDKLPENMTMELRKFIQDMQTL